MEFEQLTFESLLSDRPISTTFDRPMPITYRTLDNDGKIYCKIDWLTVMFFDCTMNHVLSWLHMDDCVSDFCAAAFQQSRGYDEVFKFIYNGVMLETSCFNFYGEDMSVSIFDTVVPKIRLELSGSALDYLRSIGVDMDSYRLVKPILPEGASYHVTRCDWAYDFINYCPEFIDQMIDHINTHKLPSERIPLASTKSAISCKLVTCGQKTIYLGSPQSDRMLRVYDKRMQSINLQTGTYVKANPYGDPDSWFRIEWQTRNKLANDLTLSLTPTGEFNDSKSILKMIFEKYAFADGTCDAQHYARGVVDFWLKLFDWREVESRIIQNVNFVKYESRSERVISTWRQIMIRNYIFIRTLEAAGFIDIDLDCNNYLRSLEGSDPASYRRFNAFYSILNELLRDINYTLPISSSSGGLWNNCGRLYFSSRGDL